MKQLKSRDTWENANRKHDKGGAVFPRKELGSQGKGVGKGPGGQSVGGGAHTHRPHTHLRGAQQQPDTVSGLGCSLHSMGSDRHNTDRCMTVA